MGKRKRKRKDQGKGKNGRKGGREEERMGSSIL